MKPGCLWIRIHYVHYCSPFSTSLYVLSSVLNQVVMWVPHMELLSIFVPDALAAAKAIWAPLGQKYIPVF